MIIGRVPHEDLLDHIGMLNNEIVRLSDDNQRLREVLSERGMSPKHEFNEAIRNGDLRKINAMANRYKVDSDE